MEDLSHLTLEEYLMRDRTWDRYYQKEHHFEQQKEKEPSFEEYELLAKFMEVSDQRHQDTEELVKMIGTYIDMELSSQQASIVNIEKQVNQISRLLQECTSEPDKYKNEPIYDTYREDDMTLTTDGEGEFTTEGELHHETVMKELPNEDTFEPKYADKTSQSDTSGKFPHSCYLLDLLIFSSSYFINLRHPFPAFCLDMLKIKCGKGDFDFPFDNG